MKKAAKLATALATSGIAVIGLAAIALAQGSNPQGNIDITGTTGGTLPVFTVAQFITWIIRIIIIAAFVISFIFLLIGGIRWILAGGEEKAIGSARGQVTGALIGLVIVLSAFAIIKLIETFFGVVIISGQINIPVINSVTP